MYQLLLGRLDAAKIHKRSTELTDLFDLMLLILVCVSDLFAKGQLPLRALSKVFTQSSSLFVTPSTTQSLAFGDFNKEFQP